MKPIITDALGQEWVDSKFKGYVRKYHTNHNKANNVSWAPCRYLDVLSLVVSSPVYYPAVSLYTMDSIYKDARKHYTNFAKLIERWNDYRFQFSESLEWFYNYFVQPVSDYKFQGYLPEFTMSQAFKDPEMGVIKSFANNARGWRDRWILHDSSIPNRSIPQYINEYEESMKLLAVSIKDYRGICILIKNSLNKHLEDFESSPSGLNADVRDYRSQLKILSELSVNVGRSGRALIDYKTSLDSVIDKMRPESNQMRF